MLRPILALVCLALSLSVLVAQSKDKDKPKEQDEQAFSEGRYRFRVALTGKCKTETKDVSYGTDAKQVVKVTIRKWEPKEGGSYSLLTADYPEALEKVEAKTILDGVRDGLRGPTELGGIVDQDKEATIGTKKLSGRELLVHAKKNWINARLVYLPPRLIQVMVTGSEAQVKHASAVRFLNSLDCEKLPDDGK